MVVFGVAAALLLIGALLLIPIGFREGDQPGDAVVLRVEPCPDPRGVRAEIRNPSPTPVLVGISLRRTGFRLCLEGVSYARLRSGRIAADLLPARQAVIAVIRAYEQEAFVVPADPGLGGRTELVLVLGQAGRLRSIHRLVKLAPASAEASTRTRDEAGACEIVLGEDAQPA